MQSALGDAELCCDSYIDGIALESSMIRIRTDADRPRLSSRRFSRSSHCRMHIAAVWASATGMGRSINAAESINALRVDGSTASPGVGLDNLDRKRRIGEFDSHCHRTVDWPEQCWQ